jgi:hypothetical protein
MSGGNCLKKIKSPVALPMARVPAPE